MVDIRNCGEDDFDKEVVNSKVPVLVDFWAEWCAPCKMLTPILEDISGELKNKIVVVKVNLDENQELAMKYSIRSIPTLLLFNEGRVLDTKVGLSPKAELVSWINSKI